MTSYINQWKNILQDAAKKERYISRVKAIDSKIGAFLSFEPGNPIDIENSTKSLAHLPVGVKDNIAVHGRPLTCGSAILKDFVAPYTATAIKCLENAGAQVVGKTNLDEFGMGSSTKNTTLGETVNPWDATKVAGGSSGGSAAAVAAGLVPLAVGSDTGGSVRQPANFCGVYGLKPTYGTVSRYGLTAYASSLEVIGTMSRDIRLMQDSFAIMRGHDPQDQSSIVAKKTKAMGKSIALLQVDNGGLDKSVHNSYMKTVETLKMRGYTVTEIPLPSLRFVVPAYYTIATAEASANLARYNGIRYGTAPAYADNPVELMRKARHEGFGDEVKLRILLGTFVLRSGFQEEYYGRAQKVRTLIRRELHQIFSTYGMILMPVFPTTAFSPGDTGMDDYQQRLADVFTCLANLAGIPALSVPIGVDAGLPTGVQFMAPAFAEERLFNTARELFDEFPLEKPDCFLDLENL